MNYGDTLSDSEKLEQLWRFMNKLRENGLDLFADEGYLQLGSAGFARLSSKGLDFVAEDSGDALAAIPNGARARWYKDSISSGVILAEMAGGYSTPSTYRFNNAVVRAFASTDGANAKLGVWDPSTGDWLRGITVQDSDVAGDTVSIFSTSSGQTSVVNYATFTFGADDAALSLLRDGVAKQVLVEGEGGSMPMPPIVGTDAQQGLGVQIAALAPTRDTSVAWPESNRRIFIPIQVTEDCTVVKVWWENGATVSGNVSFALYDNAYAITTISSGSVAQSGTTNIQESNTTDTPLTAGTYYLSLSLDNTTGRIGGWTPSIAILKGWGLAQEASAFTAPSTATPVVVATAFLPRCGISLRTLVA